MSTGLQANVAADRGGRAERDLDRTSSIPRPGALLQLPVETVGGGWWRQSVRTLLRVVAAPRESFGGVKEPVPHAPAIAFLATIRLPVWAVLVAVMVVRWFQVADGDVHPIDPSMASAPLGLELGATLSVWVLLMLPLRIPLFYFAAGLLAHIGLAITGGAHRSMGATMRATAYASAPALLVASVAEVPLYLRFVTPEQWLMLVAPGILLGYVLIAVALARTHRAWLVRGFLVGLVPLVILTAHIALPAFFELPHAPFGEAPPPGPTPFPPA